jgi:ankyrin repeat protein
MQILLQAGASVDKYEKDAYQRPPLQWAARYGNVEISDILLKAGANVYAPAFRLGGITALQGDAIGGYIEIAHTLLNHNADVNAALWEDGFRRSCRA